MAGRKKIWYEGMKCMTCTRRPRNLARVRHTKCYACSKALERRNDPIKARMYNCRDRATKKKVPYNLNLAWFTRFLRDNPYDPTTHHIDRIIPEKGYTIGNLQILLIPENIAKGNRERWGHYTPPKNTPYV